MIVCLCNNISDREIRQAAELGLSSMEELRRDLGVATCCGQCAGTAESVLQSHLAGQTAAPPFHASALQRRRISA